MFYLDSDGLFARFMPYVQKHHLGGMSRKDFNKLDPAVQKRHLSTIYRKDPEIFFKLEPNPQMAEVLLAVERTGLPWAILTAGAEDHPDHDVVVRTKKLWFEKLFGVPRDKVIVTRNRIEKKTFAQSGVMLVDDHGVNCREWVLAGGSAVKVEGDDPDIFKICRCIEVFADDPTLFDGVVLLTD